MLTCEPAWTVVAPFDVAVAEAVPVPLAGVTVMLGAELDSTRKTCVDDTTAFVVVVVSLRQMLYDAPTALASLGQEIVAARSPLSFAGRGPVLATAVKPEAHPMLC